MAHNDISPSLAKASAPIGRAGSMAIGLAGRRGLVLVCLLSACSDHDAQTGNTVAAMNSVTTSATESTGGSVDPPPSGNSMPPTTASARQNQWLSQAIAFMARPAQQRDLLTALRARAMTHPGFCPDATFAPKRVNILFDPEPQFDADGTMTRGVIVQTFTMQGCAVPVLLTIQTEAASGAPLRFIAALAGTSFAEPALQTRALPYAVAAARPLAPGCASLAPVDTRLLGGSPDVSGTLVPWTEDWLMAGCGGLISVKVHFTPDVATKQVLIRADARESTRAKLTGAAPQPTTAGAVVASATGTSLIPPGGADIPGAKVAGTCLYKLRESAPAAPDHVECPSGLPPRPGATLQCSATKGRAQGRMDVAILAVDQAANAVTFSCKVRPQ